MPVFSESSKHAISTLLLTFPVMIKHLAKPHYMAVLFLLCFSSLLPSDFSIVSTFWFLVSVSQCSDLAWQGGAAS